MSDNSFRKVFDLQKLSEHEIGCIEFVLNSPAYNDTFEPYLQGVRDSLNRLWLDRSQARKDEYPDDFLAGGIAAIDGLLNFFRLIIAETNMARVHDAMEEMTPDRQYTQRQESGRHTPVLGANQSADPDAYDPAEDF